MSQLKADILSFLSTRKSKIYARWQEKIIVPLDDQQKLRTIKTGQLLFKVMPHAFSLPEDKLDDYLKTNAKNVASMKLYQNSSISTLVYNTNMAKNELLAEMAEYPLNWEDIQPIYFQLSEIVDRFLFFVINFYTESKDLLIEERKDYKIESHEDRLTMLGQMTSSFVHEFRNPLTTIHGFIQLLRSERPELPYMEIISSELDQLNFRISQFLMLSRRETSNQEMALFTLNELLDEIASFIYPRLLESNVELERELTENLYVNGFIEEFRQVLINIIFNAIDVLQDQEATSVIKIKGYRENNSIILETSNTGPRITDELLNNIFEPFVTTKKTGTGLGLYVCKEIIEKHNGELLCTSDDEWTTFTIKIPVITE